MAQRKHIISRARVVARQLPIASLAQRGVPRISGGLEKVEGIDVLGVLGDEEAAGRDVHQAFHAVNREEIGLRLRRKHDAAPAWCELGLEEAGGLRGV